MHRVFVQDLDGSERERDAAKTAWQCRVCLSRECDAVMVGCGHLLCAQCGEAVRQRCPFCRKASAIKKIYK